MADGEGVTLSPQDGLDCYRICHGAFLDAVMPGAAIKTRAPTPASAKAMRNTSVAVALLTDWHVWRLSASEHVTSASDMNSVTA